MKRSQRKRKIWRILHQAEGNWKLCRRQHEVKKEKHGTSLVRGGRGRSIKPIGKKKAP